jgi:hypothetical protein
VRTRTNEWTNIYKIRENARERGRFRISGSDVYQAVLTIWRTRNRLERLKTEIARLEWELVVLRRNVLKTVIHAARDILRETEKRTTGGKHELKAIVDRERLEQLTTIAAVTKIFGVKITCGKKYENAVIDKEALKEIFN